MVIGTSSVLPAQGSFGPSSFVSLLFIHSTPDPSSLSPYFPAGAVCLRVDIPITDDQVIHLPSPDAMEQSSVSVRRGSWPRVTNQQGEFILSLKFVSNQMDITDIAHLSVALTIVRS